MELHDLLRKVVKELEDLQIPYIVTGSVAAMAYGEPRLTNDIDIVARIEEAHVPRLIEAFPAGAFYVSEEGMREAVRQRDQFNIIHPESGLKVDVIVGGDSPFDRSRFARARRIFPAESYQANFAAPEDVILKKMDFYREGSSEKHLRDITGILKISGEEVDWSYITLWARRLGLSQIWDAVQNRLGENE